MNHTCLKYRLIETREIEELKGTGALYEHIKTGAKVFTIKNNDKNKVFTIGFRTTPKDSTGVAHIMEHSVLCGSAKYPLKDPFVELAKGSLNTFLNAMTFPDKTLYPIASMNDRDFMNLMDVYLDSVFHPNVYTDPRIFKQEGWHYELSNDGKDDGELKINGVVYNEMKGAFSNPDSVLERHTMHTLFEDTVYSNESGGLPSDIPDLSYEEFLDFHRTYYHPSNSYIYLYGDMDMDEKLGWIDENYLSEFDRIEVDSHIDPQQPFAAPKTESRPYAVGANEDEKGKCYLSANYVIDEEYSQVNAITWQILESLLLTAPGAVLREALVKAGIGEEIYGGLCSEIMQPYFSIVAKNTDAGRQEEFKKVIRETLEKLVSEGISKKSLRAELNYIEFKFREEDYGSIPAGLAIGITMFSTWLYDKSPFIYLYYNDAINEVKKLIETDYFEQKIRRFILDNDFMAYVNIIPSRGLTDKENNDLAAKLKAYKDSLSSGETERIAADMAELKAYQAEPDAPSVLAKLPVLNVSDIDRRAESVSYVRDGSRIFTEADTHGIAYIRAMFRLKDLTEDEIQFAALVTDLIGELDTKKHSYSELYTEEMLNTGGINFQLDPLVTRSEDRKNISFEGYVYADFRTLESNIGKGFGLVSELIADTEYDNAAKITELLLEIRSRCQSKIDGASHSAAVTRAASYINAGSRFNDLVSGIAYYDFINAACRLTKEPVHMKRFIKSLKAVSRKIFSTDERVYTLYGSKAANEAMTDKIADFENYLKAAAAVKAEESEADGKTPLKPAGRELAPVSQLNEGFRSSSQVNYVARVGSFRTDKLEYTGALKVLRIMLNYEYLWINLRVLGVAYGCMSGFAKTGTCSLVSYRDPEISKTNDVYEKLPEYLDNWQGDKKTVDKYIIGAVSALDRPLTLPDKAAQAVSDCFFRTTDEELQRDREELLSCTPEDIRSMAAYIRSMLKSEAICTIGNESQITKESSLFKSVRDLF